MDLDEVLSPPRIDTGSGVVATVGEAGSVGCCCWNGGGCCWGEGWGLRLVWGWAWGCGGCCCVGGVGGGQSSGTVIMELSLWGSDSTSPWSSIELITDTSFAFFSACNVGNSGTGRGGGKAHVTPVAFLRIAQFSAWVMVTTQFVYSTLIPRANTNISILLIKHKCRRFDCDKWQKPVKKFPFSLQWKLCAITS